MTALKNLLTDDSGATLVEYALIVGLIAVACLVIIGTLGTNISNEFSKIATDV